MDYLFITDHPDIARFMDECGVGRIFIDLETLGKRERQFGRDTYISGHTLKAIAPVKAAVRHARVLVRVNPFHDGSAAEVEACLGEGADLLMLPMFHEAAEVEAFCRLVRGRVPVIPLVETGGALASAVAIAQIEGVSELFVGLNDLHIDLKMAFLFQPLAEGLIDPVAAVCHRVGKPFGFGGIARLGEGMLDPELILGEHVRLGSRWVILSRTFHRRATTLEALQSSGDIKGELAKLRAAVERLQRRTPAEVLADRKRLCDQVALLAAGKDA
jgi:2-keto-3-deoxy-L-rhamnonate aldolase RhmA